MRSLVISAIGVWLFVAQSLIPSAQQLPGGAGGGSSTTTAYQANCAGCQVGGKQYVALPGNGVVVAYKLY